MEPKLLAMVRRPLVAAVLVASTILPASIGTAEPLATPTLGAANDALTCVAPTDAAGFDAMLTAAGSPMAGQGATIVSTASAAGLDPRAIVAIAAHETMLETYAPSRIIRNPFGLGPGMTFASEADAVAKAVQVLRDYYLPEGRDTISEIASKWAPVGAANDPGRLNDHWTTGVSGYYARLGGDPARSLLVSAQDAIPTCDGASPAPASPLAAGTGPAQVVVWGGNAPAEPGAQTLEGFAFPLAVPADGGLRYTDDFTSPGTTPCAGELRRCAVTLRSAPLTHVVAASPGSLESADSDQRAQGIAFWLVRDDGNRIGYSALTSYAAGISHGARVVVGQPLGRSTGELAVTWARQGERINPFPLLEATRPPVR
jgi:hypothetical protein